MPANDDFLDVSHHQETIDWERVNVPGVIVRVANGAIGKDRQFDANWRGTVGKVRAVYYFWVDDISAAAQETTLRNALGDAKPPMIFVDAEKASYRAPGLTNAQRSDRLLNLLRRIADLNPGIYTGQYTWNNHFERRAVWKQYPLWVASYRTDAPQLPADWDDFILWQYTSTGSVSGISGNVDRNFGRYNIDWYRENWKEEGTPVAETILRWPVEGRITQHFGINEDSYSEPVGHMGVDISAVVGTPIHAPADGIVQWVDSDAGWGNYIRILHPDYGFHSFMAHMVEKSSLKSGDSVARGQVVGLTGNTGFSTGPHLHLSIRLADPDRTDAASPHDPRPTDPYLGHASNLTGYVDPVLWFNWVNEWWPRLKGGEDCSVFKERLMQIRELATV